MRPSETITVRCRQWLSSDLELALGLKRDRCSEPPTFPIEFPWIDSSRAVRRNGETEVLDLQGNQLECMEAPAGRIQVDEIHQRQVVAVALVTTDSFIVVQEITAAIENETIAIDFDWLLDDAKNARG